jgi:hypothetical protein
MPNTAGMISVPAVATNKIRINISSAIARAFYPTSLPGPAFPGSELRVTAVERVSPPTIIRTSLAMSQPTKAVFELGSA